MEMLKPGDVFVKERTFTTADVAAFAEVSRDHGTHHVEPDDQGRLLVHGLHTATIPTQIGGDLNYLAREMTFEFIRPVYTGDTVRAQLHIDTVALKASGQALTMTVTCTNQHGEVVLRGTSRGLIRG
jgi:3-hydroxybutyryl-CoA dehydratase